MWNLRFPQVQHQVVVCVAISIGNQLNAHHRRWALDHSGQTMATHAAHRPAINSSSFVKYLNQFEILAVGSHGLQASMFKCSKLAVPGQNAKHLTAPGSKDAQRSTEVTLSPRCTVGGMGECERSPSSHHNTLQILQSRTVGSLQQNNLAVDL